MRILAAADNIFLRRHALDYLEQGDVDHSIPSTGHVDDAARWSPGGETKNRYASQEDHDRLRDLGFGEPEDEDGSYRKWHEVDGEPYRHVHAIWPSRGGLWTHVKDTNNPGQRPEDSYIKTYHPDLSDALRQYRATR